MSKKFIYWVDLWLVTSFPKNFCSCLVCRNYRPKIKWTFTCCFDWKMWCRGLPCKQQYLPAEDGLHNVCIDWTQYQHSNHTLHILWWTRVKLCSLQNCTNLNRSVTGKLDLLMLFEPDYILEGWRQPVRFTKILAEIRICCCGSPTTFIVANAKKIPNWMG